MLLALALQVAGLKPEIDESLVKDLSKIAGSKAVVYLRSYHSRPEVPAETTFTFLDPKASIVGVVKTSENIKETQISQDGKMMAVRVESYIAAKTANVTDVIVVTKKGLLANTHLDSNCQMKWLGGHLLIFAKNVVRFGSDPERGIWTTTNLFDQNANSLALDGDSFWISSLNKDGNTGRLIQINQEGKELRSVEVSKSNLDPNKSAREIVLKPKGFPYLVLTNFHYTGDGFGGFTTLSLFHYDTGTEALLAKEVESDQFLWLSGPKLFGFVPSHFLRGQMKFYAPALGRFFTLGPGNMYSPSCAALDDETAIVVGGLDGSKQTIFLMKPGKNSYERITIPSVPDPSDVSACR